LSTQKTHRLATRAAHAGTRPHAIDSTPTVTPIYHSVTFCCDTMQELDEVFSGSRAGYVYGRYGNPTTTALEEAVASLEQAEGGLAFASGMAAIHAVLLAAGARAGSTVLAAQDIYGSTQALLNEILSSQGVRVRFVDTTDLDAVQDRCAELHPAALIAETISNPLLKVADLPAIAGIARAHRAAFLVDSTFASPYLVQPLTMGADVVIHSATKYLAGHGDVLAGVAVSSSEWRNRLLSVLKLTGGNLGPEESWLVLRGIRTLALRMRQHCENALAIAQWLEQQPQISRVLYPGLPSHPQHALATRLFGGRGYGGMVAFELAGARRQDVFRFFDSLQLCLPATSLGDVETLLLYPAHSSHRALDAAERRRLGISDSLVRMSVGIEAAEDLIDDLGQALQRFGE